MLLDCINLIIVVLCFNLVILKNTDNCNYFSGLRDIVFVNRMNDIKYKDNIYKMSLFDKKNYILYHRAEYSDIFNNDFNEISEHFKYLINDLLIS